MESEYMKGQEREGLMECESPAEGMASRSED